MRKSILAAALSALPFLLFAPSALATVSHGDYLGTSVDFLDVEETTQTAGDPEPLWEAPTLSGSGDQLLFFPPNFTSTCASGSSDTTASVLTTTLTAHPGGHIDTVQLAENGDATLTSFPPFGTAATNASTSLTGMLTVTADINGPIAPVMIPFSGTFTPSANFALPTDFGTKNWDGVVNIDVAAAVANAAVVELSLENTLATNCAAGNTTGKIQKKVVSGPSVAISVNPVTCALDLDKTCCVVQPVLPDLDICEGEVVHAWFEFTGESCKSCNNDQGKHMHCNGRRGLDGPASIDVLDDAAHISATPNSGIQKGDIVEFSGSLGKLNPMTKFKVTGNHWRKQHMKIDTSCERALHCGDQFGAFKLVALESTLGGYVDCNDPPPAPEGTCGTTGDPEGTPCDAKLVDMVLEYQGQDCQDPLANPQNGEASCVGDATGATNVGIVYAGKFPNRQQVSPASNVNDGDRIRVTATFHGGLFPNQKFLITDQSGVRQTVEFHVSCSQPLALGDQFGSFKLVEWTTKSGTKLALGDPVPPADSCEVPLAPPGPHCTDDLTELTLVYIGDFLGEGCTVSNPQGGYATCSGVADPGDPVSVVPGSYLVADPEDGIEFGDLVTLTPTGGNDLGPLTTLSATGAGGSQSIQIKTSCSKPLSLGDRFGAWVVFGMDREDDGPISLGGGVQYQYKVTNPNPDPVDNVAITDSELGEIVSGLSLAPGEMQTFTKGATLFGTTTNVATASGDVAGDVCDPGVDQVTVNVLAPPPGSFSCSEPISELTMIWNGAQAVDVKAWAGDPGVSTLLGTYMDVHPGDAITVSGLGASFPIWEVFAAGGAKIGESSFDLWCNDYQMNGVEDCGRNEGNLKYDYGNLINDWLLEGMVDSDETLECTPGSVPSVPPCGFGPELLFVMPGLLWLHRRRLRKQD